MPRDLRVFGASPEMEKEGQAAWRMLSRLPGLLGRMGAEAKPHWTNLSALKQTVGTTLREPGRDLISRRVANIAADAKESHLAPFKAQGDSAWLAELDRMHVPSTHEELFLRHGQPVPAADGRLFRGTVGGDPWGGGSFGGAFHYAAPDKATSSLFGRLDTPFLEPEKRLARSTLSSANTMEAIHHYGSAPGQKVWRPWGPEDAVTGTARNRALNASQNYSQMLGNAETTVMPQHNPFLGTELRASGFDREPLWLSEQHGYFPAGRASAAAQNYRNQTAQSVRWTQGGPAATQFEQVSGLNTTPWTDSIRRNPRMMRMHAENPEALRELMSRRADRILGPDPALMFKSGSTIGGAAGRAPIYAQRAAARWLDTPAVMRSQIQAKHLLAAPNSYEAAITREHVPFMRGVQVEHAPIDAGQLGAAGPRFWEQYGIKSAAFTPFEKLARYRRIDHARPNPSQAQIASQNFKMGHVDFHGLDITIENEKDSVRRGTTKEGKKWESVLTCPYGYIRSAAGGKSGERVRPKAIDGDHLDVFVGPNKASELVVVIDQHLGGKYDESKFLLGCDSQDEGVRLYRSNYQRGWPEMPSTTCTLAQFKEWLKDGDHKKPFAGQMVKAASRFG